GYVAETNLNAPQQNSVTYVSASWVVPAVGPSTDISAWVGIDGKSSFPVEQVGTRMMWTNGAPVYYAWWEMFPQGEQRLWGMTVSPGDGISAWVQSVTSGPLAGWFELSITDASRPNDSFITLQPPSGVTNGVPQRNSAEWIVENHLANTPSFGTVEF